MRAAIVAAIVLAAAPARADDRAHAKRLYEQGLAHYSAGEYAEAIAAWKQAYQIQPSPILLFNIGQAYRLSGDCAQAVTYYDSYTHEAPNPPNQDELDRARALCKPQLPTVEAIPSTPPPVIDTRPAPPVVESPRADVAVEVQPQPSLASHAERTAGIAIGGAGVALDLAAIYFAIASSNESGKLDHYTGVWTSDQIEIQQRGQRDVVLGYTFGAVGTAAVLAGGVLFLLDRGSGEHAVSVAPIRGGAALAWTRRF